MLLLSNRIDWFGTMRADILAGIVVALALIPEAIAFSIIAGVDPKVGLYASFAIATVTAFTGGRTGMISAATGAMALLMVTLVKTHGLQYLLAATVLTGLLQMVAGYLNLGNLMRFVSRSVVTGFVNALAILIFLAQLPELIHAGWQVYALTVGGLAIIYLFPFINKNIPSPLIAILVLTALAVFFHLPVRTVGDMGDLPDTLPVFLWPNIPFNLETLHIIFPYAFGLAVVGLLESMMTATIVDDLTDSKSNKNRECKAQGLANIVAGCLGGMAGCAMIGQSVINVKSGGRGRLSTLTAGVMLLFMVVFLNEWVSKIPMAALVSVMIMVSIGTFSWKSLKNLKTHPLSSNIVMLSTVIVVVATHNLAYGVFVGVVIAALFFAHKVGRLVVVQSSKDDDASCRAYKVRGQIFFASSEQFFNAFDMKETLEKVIIDVSEAHFWDITAVSTLDKVVLKFRERGMKVAIIGKNEASATIIELFAVHDKPEKIKNALGAH
ncbi:SulP family inorganic anion transporter [Legionella spiritensis]|uniref:Sulfate transporter n=1 Tax=Legionella spiritensis TaxID=452 RepID=A0A0W0YZB1_LEGSP|nr:sulfate transporter [Legionella spiritensis]SNV31505.1 sulfate permease [Legionella spiritensis]